MAKKKQEKIKGENVPLQAVREFLPTGSALSADARSVGGRGRTLQRAVQESGWFHEDQRTS